MPRRSLSSLFNLDIFGHTLKVVLPSVCQVSLKGVYRCCCYHIAWEAVSEVHKSVCKVGIPKVETMPGFLKFRGVASDGSQLAPGDVEGRT